MMPTKYLSLVTLVTVRKVTSGTVVTPVIKDTMVTPVTKILFMLLLAFMVMVTPVTAVDLNCDMGAYHFIQSNPFSGVLDKDASALYTACDFAQENVSEDFYCITHIYAGDNLVQTNPKAIYLEEVGVIDSFASFGDLVNVYFNSENIYLDREYMYEVVCSTGDGDETGTFQKNVTVVYQSMSWVAPLTVWFVGNSAYFIMAIIIIIILIMVFKGLKKAW